MTTKETIKNNGSNSSEDKKNGLDAAGLIEETKQELGKVVWPSRQQLLSESVAVMLMVTVVATLIYLVDNVFGWVAGKVF